MAKYSLTVKNASKFKQLKQTPSFQRQYHHRQYLQRQYAFWYFPKGIISKEKAFKKPCKKMFCQRDSRQKTHCL
jgi:hypothetical protein